MSAQASRSATETGRVAVLGAGAVGAHLGALLSIGGIDTTLIGRAKVLDHMTDGVRVALPSGKEMLARPKIRTEPASEGQFDWVLLTVKAYSVEGALDEIDGLLAPAGRVAAFQNGVGSDEILVTRLGRNRVIAATSTVSVGIDSPGVVTQYTTGGLAWSDFGGSPDGIAQVFTATGMPVVHCRTPESLRWSKLLLNAVGSAQAAILGLDLREIANNSRLFRVEWLAFRERLAVMRAAQIVPIDLPGFRVRLASRMIGLPAPVSKALLSSRISAGRGDKLPTLRADVERGGPTENEFLNEATVAKGRSFGVAAPVNQTLATLVDEATVSAQRRVELRADPNIMLRSMRANGADV